MSYGITDEGFIIKPFDVLVNEILTRQRKLFGEDIYQGAESFWRKQAEVFAAEIHNQWKLLAQYYYSGFISTASGNSLDLLADNYGLRRKASEKANGYVTFQLSGTTDANVPTGSVIETTTGDQFETDEELDVYYGSSDNLVLINGMTNSSGYGDENYLPQPYDLNNNLTVVGASSQYTGENGNFPESDGTQYISTDTSYVYYSYGMRDNITFSGYDGITVTRANIVWNNPARTLDGLYVVDDSASTWTLHTDLSGGVDLFNDASPDANDFFVIGSNRKFSRATFTISSATGSSSGTTMIAEYYDSDGDEWIELSSIEDETHDGTDSLAETTDPETVTFNFTETEWNQWGKTNNATETSSSYFIKISLSDAVSSTASPVVTDITLDNGVIPSTSATYNLFVIGNKWDQVTATAIVAGTDSNVASDNIRVIVSGIDGISRVTNQEDLTNGRDRETDSSFISRIVQYKTTFYTKNNTLVRLQGINGVDAINIRDGKRQERLRYTSASVRQTAVNAVVNHSGTNDALEIEFDSKFTAAYINVTGSPSPTDWEVYYSITGDAWSADINNTDETSEFANDGWVFLNVSDLSAFVAHTDEKFKWRIYTGNNTLAGITFTTDVTDVRSDLSSEASETAPSSHEGILRLIHHDVSEGSFTTLTTELTGANPTITAETQFWCDYANPSEMWVHPEILGVNDELIVYYIDHSVGSQSVDVVVLPTDSPMSEDIYDDVYDIVNNTAPWITRFVIKEAVPSVVNISALITYDSTNYDVADIQSDMREALLSQYFNALSLGETVYRNKIIGIMLTVDGITDIEQVTFELVDETGYGQDDIDTYMYFNTEWAIIDDSYLSSTKFYRDNTADGEFIEETVEAIKDATDDPPKGSVGVDSGAVSPTTNWKMTYISTEGNIEPRTDEIAKLGTVTLS
jgi:uncharacterized phage protein gp47/JayE